MGMWIGGNGKRSGVGKEERKSLKEYSESGENLDVSGFLKS